MPVTHGVTGSSPVRTAKTASIQKIGVVFCLYSSFPTVGQSAQNTYIPKAAHWPAGKRTLKHPQRITQKRSAFFVRVFRDVLKRVFRGQKISGLLFKISGSDFEIRATSFLFAPMLDKCTENQFPIFAFKNARFTTPVLRPSLSAPTKGTDNCKQFFQYSSLTHDELYVLFPMVQVHTNIKRENTFYRFYHYYVLIISLFL